MTSKLKMILCGALALSAFTSIAPVSAHAWGYGYHYGRPAGWGGGHWIHDRHDGRLGWWWVVGPSWYFYPRPYAVVQPQTVIVEQAPPVAMMQPAPIAPAAPVNPVLYYCKATGTHYPETMSCPGGWSVMTAQTPPPS